MEKTISVFIKILVTIFVTAFIVCGAAILIPLIIAAPAIIIPVAIGLGIIGLIGWGVWRFVNKKM